jgi:hypothetical protein
MEERSVSASTEQIASAETAVAIERTPDIPIADFARRTRMIDLGFCPEHSVRPVALVYSETDGLREAHCPECPFVYRERQVDYSPVQKPDQQPA